FVRSYFFSGCDSPVPRLWRKYESVRPIRRFLRPRGKSCGARKKELGRGEYLFRQADLLAEGLKPGIAAQQSGMFTVHTEQEPAHPDGPNLSHVVQSFEGAILIAQTGE